MAQRKPIVTVQGIKNLKVTGDKYTVTIKQGVPGWGVKVTEVGGKFYTLTTRFPGAKATSQLTLGSIDELAWEDARAKAKDWLSKIEAGIDPRKPVEDGPATAVTFGKAAASWLAYREKDLRSIKDVRNQVRRMTDVWEHKLLTEIKLADVKALLASIKPSVAHNVFSTLRSMYNHWRTHEVLPEDAYSPTDLYKASDPANLGVRPKRKRSLEESEIVTLWHKSVQLGYPYGDLFRTLLLTGGRRNEWAEAEWKEVVGNTLIVPAARFKSGKGSGRDGRIAINSEVRKILAAVPHKEGYIFSFNGGLTAMAGSKVNEAKATLRDLGTGKQWQFHDFRRNLTKGLRRDLKVDKVVREVMLNHSLKSLDASYEDGEDDAFDDERLAASEAWAQHVIKLVTPPTDAIDLAAERKKRKRA